MNGLRRRLHALWRELLQEHTAPGRLAAAVLVGCIVGCTPLFGLHFFVCVALAYALGLNKLVVYGAANLSIPPMVPLLGFASVQLGERLSHGRWLALHRSDFALANVRALAKVFFVDWMVGGLVLGAAIGVVAGGLTWAILARRRTRAGAAGDALGQAIERARRRYDGLHPKYKWYARMKYVMDPCYRAIVPLVPPGAFTVDLGSGLGMLPVLLGVVGDGRRALGVEWDAAKVACGAHASRDLDGIQVLEGDARDADLPACDVITLVDMLHYWDAGVQRALLSRCRAALRPGGRLLVREGDPAARGGARWTRFVEGVVTRLGWNRGPAVRFRPVAELRADLEALGFAVRIDEVAARTHPGNVLLVAELPHG
ncbi:MAG: hypothetical protein JWN44_5723 [Myxococcales bacterium]|nr:hypothetical protein [Myxococcales bacterium]